MLKIILYNQEFEVNFEYNPEDPDTGLHEYVEIEEVYWKNLEVSDLLEAIAPSIWEDIEEAVLKAKEEEKWEFKIAQNEIRNRDM